LPDVPEIAAYHVALTKAAERLSAPQRAGATDFLEAAAAEAQAAASKMRERALGNQGEGRSRSPSIEASESMP
jgi:hypothetical protein